MSSPKRYDGTILIAMPQIKTSIFRKSVVYVHSDDQSGSLGFLLNVPMDQHQAKVWSRDISWEFPEKVFLGGPVDRHMGYVVHSNDYMSTSTINLNDHISYTGGKGIVEDIHNASGPNQFTLLTGYCSWQPGQLAREIDRGDWYITNFDKDYFFQISDRETGWEIATAIASENEVEKLFKKVDIDY